MGKHYVCDKHKTKGNTGKCPLCQPDHIVDADKKAQPAPAPLPSFAFDNHIHALKFIAASLTDLGGEQEALDTVCAHISDLARRLAEREKLMLWLKAECEKQHAGRESAEARVRELAALKTHHEGIVEKLQRLLLQANLRATDIEAERDALRWRCGKLENALHISAQDLAFVASHSQNIQLATMARKSSNDAYAARRAALAATEVKP